MINMDVPGISLALVGRDSSNRKNVLDSGTTPLLARQLADNSGSPDQKDDQMSDEQKAHHSSNSNKKLIQQIKESLKQQGMDTKKITWFFKTVDLTEEELLEFYNNPEKKEDFFDVLGQKVRRRYEGSNWKKLLLLFVLLIAAVGLIVAGHLLLGPLGLIPIIIGSIIGSCSLGYEAVVISQGISLRDAIDLAKKDIETRDRINSLEEKESAANKVQVQHGKDIKAMKDNHGKDIEALRAEMMGMFRAQNPSNSNSQLESNKKESSQAGESRTVNVAKQGFFVERNVAEQEILLNPIRHTENAEGCMGFNN